MRYAPPIVRGPTHKRPMVHPQLPANVSWSSKHRPARLADDQPHRMALCLFGIPASVGVKAGQMWQNASVIGRAAASQLAALPPHTDVYSHAWRPREKGDEMCKSVALSYRPRAHLCEPIVFDSRRSLYSYEHVQSMILSITRVLALAATQRYKQLVLARHDVLFCDRVPMVLPGQFVVVGSWQNSSIVAQRTQDGIPDYSFTGDPLTLAYVFETLYTRFERREAHQPAPDPTGWRAHFVVQSHLDDLGLTRRRYVTYVDVRQRLLREGSC